MLHFVNVRREIVRTLSNAEFKIGKSLAAVDMRLSKMMT